MFSQRCNGNFKWNKRWTGKEWTLRTCFLKNSQAFLSPKEGNAREKCIKMEALPLSPRRGSCTDRNQSAETDLHIISGIHFEEVSSSPASHRHPPLPGYWSAAELLSQLEPDVSFRSVKKRCETLSNSASQKWPCHFCVTRHDRWAFWALAGLQGLASCGQWTCPEWWGWNVQPSLSLWGPISLPDHLPPWVKTSSFVTALSQRGGLLTSC